MKKKVFVCYDYESDSEFKDQLLSWSSTQSLEMLVGEKVPDFASLSENETSSLKNLTNLKNASTFFCIVGEKTASNEQVAWEISKAIELKKDIVAVKAAARAAVPERLKKTANWASAFEPKFVSKAINAIEDIVNLIIQDRVIPVIGYEVLFWLDNGKSNLKSKFIEEICNELSKEYGSSLELFSNKYPDAPLTELINFIYHALPADQKSTFQIDFSEAITNIRKKGPIYFDPLIKLARIKNFQLYINATCMNALKIAISSYKSKQFEEYGFTRDLPPPKEAFASSGRFKLRFNVPLIYNLFGTHSPAGDYHLTDANYVDLLTDLLQEGNNSRFPNLKDYLKKQLAAVHWM